MSVKINKGNALDSLSMTPLIDVVFLLIIFFLVATRFQDEERDLDVQLPEASEAQPLTEQPKDMFVNIDDQGRYFVAGKQLDAPAVLAALRRASTNNPGRQRVYIRADRACAFDYVAKVMDLCNKAHIRDYSVTTSIPGG